MKLSLDELREDMRKKDREIIRLLNERSQISVRIGQVKGQAGLEVYNPAQEARVLRYLQELNDGPLSDRQVTSIFREILSASRDLQKPMNIAYLGPEASFSHQAARLHFGTSSRFLPQQGIARVFDEVEKGAVEWGVVPVENSLEGSVNVTLDRLVLTPLKIQAEMYLRISQCLISSAKSMKGIKNVYSHPQGLAQCQAWLRAHLPNAVLGEMESTAAAVQMVCGKKSAAAIGSALAASTYGLNKLAEGIEDNSSNTTRFLVIGRGDGTPTEHDKTSLIFATPDSPGALHRALASFAKRKINLAKIESHPVKERMWEYLFFVDMIGHMRDKAVKSCLNELKDKTIHLKILGSYPRAKDGL
ncbi:MAG TPA: prephenate dehydratase [Smithellaceae bacterium]|nr:prephenate dehydratase [Smithellaceae bacterium]HRY37319.1 prephenate dehydratase [Smithellaceae bacterium]